MVPADSSAEPKRWIGIALAALLAVSFALRTWDASQHLGGNRYFDENYSFKNVTAILMEGDFRPRQAYYLGLSYLPQTAVLAASEALYRLTRYSPLSIYGEAGGGYSPTAIWLCRMVNVLYGVASLWLLFLVGQRLYSPGVGLLAAAILAAFTRHVQASVEFKPDILVLLLTVLTFYWTLKAAAEPRLGRFLLVGLGVGLGVATKYTAIASAIPITTAVLIRGRHDRRQWGWLLLAGLTSFVTFIALNPFLGVIFRYLPRLTRSYAWRGAREESGHWVVFQRQIRFLIDHHGPVVAAFVALGIAGLVWRIARPAREDTPERRLGSILVLSLLLGYSLLHSLGTSLFRGQNYIPVVPFSSLAAAWAMASLWRALARRVPGLASRPAAALACLSVGGALVAQQGAIVYHRVVPTNFTVAGNALLGRLKPLGLRHIVYEQELGAFR
ncbi:MAG TPA: glycosyltransferase family 39 protein, partial [Thermoanaerobaculia bacterium]